MEPLLQSRPERLVPSPALNLVSWQLPVNGYGLWLGTQATFLAPAQVLLQTGSHREPPLTELLGPPVPLNVISGIDAESNKSALALRPDTDHF